MSSYIKFIFWNYQAWFWKKPTTNDYMIIEKQMGGGSRCRFSAGELTLNCMSLSLLEVDLDEKALVAGKQTNNTANTMSFWSTIINVTGPYFYLQCQELPADSNRVSFMLYTDEYLSLRSVSMCRGREWSGGKIHTSTSRMGWYLCNLCTLCCTGCVLWGAIVW